MFHFVPNKNPYLVDVTINSLAGNYNITIPAFTDRDSFALGWWQGAYRDAVAKL